MLPPSRGTATSTQPLDYANLHICIKNLLHDTRSGEALIAATVISASTLIEFAFVLSWAFSSCLTIIVDFSVTVVSVPVLAALRSPVPPS